MISVAEAATSPGEVTEAGGEDGEVLVRVYSEDSAYVDTTTAPPDNRYTGLYTMASTHCLYTLASTHCHCGHLQHKYLLPSNCTQLWQ